MTKTENSTKREKRIADLLNPLSINFVIDNNTPCK